MGHKKNRLIHSSSPYLLQHASNPVDWHEWGEEALQKAVATDKPILVSIGYSACHWCHVMERESFEVEDIAKVMNDFFVCIKVDREERPDIDHVYMDAVQALGIHGGWPLNVFLTPDQKPFFGGTYFSPQSWVQILTNIHQAYVGNRKQLGQRADEIAIHLLRSDVARLKQADTNPDWQKDIHTIYNQLKSHFDLVWGGMDRAPKFIMPSIWFYLLRFYNLSKDSGALNQIKLTLNKIAEGGIYDQIGGGFARYSVDPHWFAPHFEKMLYDNAQLLSLYAETYAVTNEEIFKNTVYETFDWLNREMTHPGGGFYSALDADSEGVEGLYYVWTKKELEEILGEDEKLVSAYYGVTASGNWEHGRNILKRDGSDENFLLSHNLTSLKLKEILNKTKQKLLVHRDQRIRPGLDDKIITSWNAMTVCGLVDAFCVFDDQKFLDAALKNMQFIERELAIGTKLFRSFRVEKTNIHGFLDDYAYVIKAQIKLYQATFDEQWIRRAGEFILYTLEHFFDTEEGFFNYTSTSSETLITQKKEIFDNVIPSSNAIMARNLYHAGTMLDKEEWQRIAESMTSSLAHLIKSEPNYMSEWAMVHTEINKGMHEVLLVGNGIQQLRRDLQKEFHPFILVQGSKGSSNLPLFKDKTPVEGKDTIYVCQQKTCLLPVHTLEEARKQFV